MLITRIVVLKKDKILCRRSRLSGSVKAIATFETWLVIPITNEKWRESQASGWRSPGKLNLVAISVESSRSW